MLEQAIYKNIELSNNKISLLISLLQVMRYKKDWNKKRIYEHDFVTIINQMLFPIVFKASFLFFTKLKVNPQKDVMAVKYHF